MQPFASCRGTSRELHRAGLDPDRLLIVEVSDNYPRTAGYLPDYRHALHIDEIDVLVEERRGAARSRRPAADG